MWLVTWDPTQPVATRPLAIRINGTWYTYGWDLTKNICELYSTEGRISTSYTYSPFGKVTATGSLAQPIQWSSEIWDSELGLVYYNYRYYCYLSGNWINRDRLQEKYCFNLYNYAHNSSITYKDEKGDRVYHLISPKGANYQGHSMYIIGNESKGFKVYSYGPDHARQTSSWDNFTCSSKTDLIYGAPHGPYKTYAEAYSELNEMEKQGEQQNRYCASAPENNTKDKPIEGAQMWNTTIEEDEIAWNIADRYFEQSYSITSHNCYQLGTTVLRGLNSRRRELKYKASQVRRPNTAFLNNIYYKYAVEVDQETGIPTGRDIDAEWDKINQTLDLLYL